MIDFRQARFLASGADQRSFLTDRPQVVFIGRSNAGKSSLINACCDNRKLMKVSKEAGRTRLMNYLDLGGRFYLVDAPGYGYAAAGDFTRLLSEYFYASHRQIRGVYWLLDPLRPLKPADVELLAMIDHYELSLCAVFAKTDKLKLKEKNAAKRFESAELTGRRVIWTSARTGVGLEELRTAIAADLASNH